MRFRQSVVQAAAIALVAALALACKGDASDKADSLSAASGLPDSTLLATTAPDRGQADQAAGPADGAPVAQGTTWDAADGDVRVVIKYEASSHSFIGRLENTSAATLCAVRAVIRLGSGTELGPTKAADVPAGESVPVDLSTNGAAVATWTARAETSPCP